MMITLASDVIRLMNHIGLIFADMFVFRSEMSRLVKEIANPFFLLLSHQQAVSREWTLRRAKTVMTKMKTKLSQPTISPTPLYNLDFTCGLKGELLLRENFKSSIGDFIPSALLRHRSPNRSSSRAQARTQSILTSLDLICGISPVAHF